jgi:hypothetical protein
VNIDPVTISGSRFNAIERHFLLSTTSGAATITKKPGILYKTIEHQGRTMHIPINLRYDTDGDVFATLSVRFRKTSQIDKIGHQYRIYNEGNTPILQVQKALEDWLKFFYLQCSGQARFYSTFTAHEQAQMYLFPKMKKTGVVMWGEIDRKGDCFRNQFKAVLRDADIDSAEISRGMHCFRRGGLQYRYIHCRWRLDLCRWWGHWSSNDHLVKYLLEEADYEADIEKSSMLKPKRQSEPHAQQTHGLNLQQIRDMLTEALNLPLALPPADPSTTITPPTPSTSRPIIRR